MSPARRGGFSLIEVTVALVVGGMALSAAAALLSGLGDREHGIRAAAARVDRDANAERLLRGLWGNLRLSVDSAVRGDAAVMEFQSWCETVEGWLRPCHARLAVEREGDGFQFRLALTSGDTHTMTLWRTDRAPAGIRYLRNVTGGGTWVSRWSDNVVPSAVEVIVGPDTLLLPTW
jgi:prepilin-type N-terminal cleavage/methylation domain-containing protein